MVLSSLLNPCVAKLFVPPTCHLPLSLITLSNCEVPSVFTLRLHILITNITSIASWLFLFFFFSFAPFVSSPTSLTGLATPTMTWRRNSDCSPQPVQSIRPLAPCSCPPQASHQAVEAPSLSTSRRHSRTSFPY